MDAHRTGWVECDLVVIFYNRDAALFCSRGNVRSQKLGPVSLLIPMPCLGASMTRRRQGHERIHSIGGSSVILYSDLHLSNPCLTTPRSHKLRHTHFPQAWRALSCPTYSVHTPLERRLFGES